MLATGYQLAAARALIGLDQVKLAEMVGLSANTIRSMEASRGGAIAGRAANVQAVQRTLEVAGVEFLNHGQPGVRLRKHGRGRADVDLIEEAARMFEADHPGLKFESSSRPRTIGQDTELIASPDQHAEYLARAKQKLAGRE